MVTATVMFTHREPGNQSSPSPRSRRRWATTSAAAATAKPRQWELNALQQRKPESRPSRGQHEQQQQQQPRFDLTSGPSPILRSLNRIPDLVTENVRDGSPSSALAPAVADASVAQENTHRGIRSAPTTTPPTVKSARCFMSLLFSILGATRLAEKQKQHKRQ